MTQSHQQGNPCCAALRDLAGAVEKFIAAGHLPVRNGASQEANDMVEAMHRASQVLANHT